MDLVCSSLWLAVVIWLILRAVSQRGLLPRLRMARPPLADSAPHITVVIPARDEAANIERCVRSLLAQDYPASRLSVLVIDDHSADGTAAIVRAIAAQQPKISLQSTPALPPRWTGKSHACWIGARAASTESEWLCFMDADVWGKPSLLSSAIHAASTRDLDLLSLAPRQELQSFAERLMLPCGFILLSFLQDLREVQGRSRSAVTAIGQFMLIRRDAYEAVGGHAAVSNVICEDLEFARLLKQSERSVLLMGGGDMIATRMYTGWRTLWPGFAKNLVDTLGGPGVTLRFSPLAVLLAWAAVALPIIDAFACWQDAPGAWTALAAALFGSAAAFALHVAATFYFRIPFWYGLLFPLGYTVGAAIAIDSVRRRLTGQVIWKGRMYS